MFRLFCGICVVLAVLASYVIADTAVHNPDVTYGISEPVRLRSLSRSILTKSQLDKPVGFPSRENVISFYSRQMGEHTYFLYLMLQEPVPTITTRVTQLKQTAVLLTKGWKAFCKSYADQLQSDSIPVISRDTNPNMESISSGVAILDQQSAGSLQPLLESLLRRTESFKSELRHISQTEWIGWLLPSVLDYMMLEINWFRQQLVSSSSVSLPQATINDEVNYCSQIGLITSELIPHFLDAKEYGLIDWGRKLSDKFRSAIAAKSNLNLNDYYGIIRNPGLSLKLYIKTVRSLDKSRQVKSIFHPLALTHIYRNVIRCLSSPSLQQFTHKLPIQQQL